MIHRSTNVNIAFFLMLACGSLTTARAQNCVLRWDPRFANPGINGVIRAMEVYDPGSGLRLYAAGRFTLAGTVPALQIVSWNGTTWQAVGGGLPGTGSTEAFALEAWNGRLFVGGTINTAGATPVSRIAQWNGTTWGGLRGGTTSTIFALGGSDIASPVGPALYVGGAFNNADSTPNVNGIAKWNGTTWSAVGGGMRAIDGSIGTVYSIVVHNGFVYVGGAMDSAFNGPGQTNAVTINYLGRWNGSTWAALAGGLGGLTQPFVWALEVFNGDLIAGGSFTTAGGVPANYIARWNGSAWSALGTGMAGILTTLRNVRALTTWDDGQGGGPALYAGGEFQRAGGILVNQIAKWNGTTWSGLSTGMNAAVHALAPYNNIDNALYSGGFFTTSGGRVSEHVGKWWCIPLNPEGCCFLDGSCQDLNFNQCQSAGGVAQGPGTDCAIWECPQPPQACCFNDGTCQDILVTTCMSVAGTPLGPNSLCSSANCPQPRACCFTNAACLDLQPSECSDRGGTPQAAGIQCAITPCTEACCLPSNQCSNLSSTQCVAQGGSTQGSGTRCATSECPQACCLPDNSCIEVRTASCLSQGGTPRGTATICAELTCPQACCLPNNSCTNSVRSSCLAQGGNPQGTGTNCATAECPQACGFPDGSCRDDLLASACVAQGGCPCGPNSNCVTTGCDCFWQACCLPNASCQNLSVASCSSQGGTPQGGGTTCATTICTGACCRIDGICDDLTTDQCAVASGSFQGQGTQCATTACPRACCRPDGTCSVLPQTECTQIAQGFWLSPGQTCLADCAGETCTGVLRGDFTDDGLVRGDDIRGFTTQMRSPDPPVTTGFCRANLSRGDVPEVLNAADVTAFVTCLLYGGPCP